jgi:hypothetical protein
MLPAWLAAENPVAGRGLLAAPLQDQILGRSKLLRLRFAHASPAIVFDHAMIGAAQQERITRIG